MYTWPKLISYGHAVIVFAFSLMLVNVKSPDPMLFKYHPHIFHQISDEVGKKKTFLGLGTK